MKRVIIWLVSGLIMIAFLLASCSPAVVNKEEVTAEDGGAPTEEFITEEAKETKGEEVVTAEEETVIEEEVTETTASAPE